MKLRFTFSDSPNLATLTVDDLRHSQCEFPDAVLRLPDVKERILALANHVGLLTCAVLHVTCKELALINHPIKLERTGNRPSVNFGAGRPLILRFRRSRHMPVRPYSMMLKIVSPEPPHIPNPLKHWLKGKGIIPLYLSGERPRYPELERIYQIAELCLPLLNEQQVSDSQWSSHFELDPFWFDAAASKRTTKLFRKREREKKRREKQQERLEKALAEGKMPASVPTV